LCTIYSDFFTIRILSFVRIQLYHLQHYCDRYVRFCCVPASSLARDVLVTRMTLRLHRYPVPALALINFTECMYYFAKLREPPPVFGGHLVHSEYNESFTRHRSRAMHSFAALIATPSPPSAFATLNEILRDLEEAIVIAQERAGNRPHHLRLTDINNDDLAAFLKTCLTKCVVPSAFLHTLISGVSKPGKDPTCVEGFRGVGLLSVYKLESTALLVML